MPERTRNTKSNPFEIALGNDVPGSSGSGGTAESPTPRNRYSAVHRTWRRIVIRAKIFSWNLAVSTREPIKRVFDILGATVLIILSSPIMLLTYIAIRLQDGGPAIFTQTRVGKWGKHFKFYKFRSMVMNAEALKPTLLPFNEMNGVTFKMKNDPRITRVGRIIRKLTIDELPQLFCVLKGDMSLVGPRPPLPSEVSEYTNHHLYRLDATPGLTCIWQVSGRNRIQFDDQVRLDLEYIHKRTLREDIRLLLKTVYAIISTRGAS